ncbi:hypothetical protein FY034_12355 [Trichlorobacter lovleyi]|uniref:hypothetical protein n=1 Tax=Trichlorobacter lovleyi TaxID=313985 RepID=UPI002240C62A|nr:hypothetical protein [Trichlorobacter lovleyi]QOX79700.1 hypothetical protein FY034_12355 [Trichlorobacter lovleyi]
MAEQKPRLWDHDLFWAVLLLCVVILFCGRILFTDQIIRASDVITQFFWAAKQVKQQTPFEYLTSVAGAFQANWEPFSDGGRSLEGGWNAITLLFHRYLIQRLLPFPASIAWLAVLALAWGGIGTFYYCRKVGIGRAGAFLAGLLFALCSENLTLINAGHIQKIEAIAWLPWIMLSFEAALSGGRLFYYTLTSLLLALQFFHMHWQISFYTCLAVALYWLFWVVFRWHDEEGGYRISALSKDVALAIVMVTLFFSTIAMSFAPLLSWSKQSERGGGMSQTQGMSWSMPPEEIATFLIPGMFGFSRQEAGDTPQKGEAYYWGRMYFTQTSDYLGLLPWFLLPLPLLFRRDRLTWFFSFLMGSTLLMALGKYTFVYQFMFDHLPGFSTFRVPKMILFLCAFAAAVLMGRAIDLLLSDQEELQQKLPGWIAAIALVVLIIGALWLQIMMMPDKVLALTRGFIDEPTRYQSGIGLINERIWFMLTEVGTAFGIACVYLVMLFAGYKRWLRWSVIVPLLGLLLVADLWRVNTRFLVVTAPPVADKQRAKTDTVAFLEKQIGLYRMQPLNEQEAHYYSDYHLPTLASYVTVSEKRYREYLDNLALLSAMPDIMNLKYLVMPANEYNAQKELLARKYQPVFKSANNSIVLENRAVLPKAWLVPAIRQIASSRDRIAFMRGPQFDPRAVAVVESAPPFALPGGLAALPAVSIERYESNRIRLSANTPQSALLVLGEKYYNWWYAIDNGKPIPIVPVNHILRGVYLTPGKHTVEFRFDPLPFKIGKWLTLGSFALFGLIAAREWWLRRQDHAGTC